ncbi:hypothetical protein DSO57_1034091 [Entomophthora muscae]|uniref:Uncharacterized protein n=1 Tax=Entomophthora muscae TaxID=34485 RepID=A0ACC2TLZ2_9FUNG|nr:hypothetical protein DSO57_1034091 [Entomophthora muscae]
MSEYLLDIKNFPGKKNVVANELSRQGGYDVLSAKSKVPQYVPKLQAIYTLLSQGEMSTDFPILKECILYITIESELYRSMDYKLTNNVQKPINLILVNILFEIGKEYIIISSEYFTKWPVARACTLYDTETTARFLHEEIFAVYDPSASSLAIKEITSKTS